MSLKFLTKNILSILLVIFVLQIVALLPIEAQTQHPLIGKKAPDIVLPDRQDNLRKLSNLSGKYVLLHFWATWDNQTAATGHAEYKQLYDTFKPRSFKGADGFTIYSVAFDEDKSKWLNQISKDGITWIDLVIERATYDSQYWNTYSFNTLPYSFLLDPTGKVIGENMSYDDLYTKLNGLLVSPIPPPKSKDDTDEPVDKPTDKPIDKPVDKPTDVEIPPITTPTSGKVYKAQLGVFREPDPSKFKNLEDLGTLEIEKVSSTSSLSRVLIGNYDKTSADKVLPIIQSRGYAGAFLVTRTLSGSSGGSSTGSGSGSTTDKPITPPDTSPTGSVMVYKIQLGVFGSPDLSKFSDLKSIGELEMETTPSGLKRVLLGTFNASEKDAALQKVAAKGHPRAFLVTRTEKASAGNSSGSTNTPSPSGNYKIQLGVFGKPDLSKFSNLKDLGTLDTEKATTTLQRVMLGSFSESKANEILEKVKSRGYRDAFIVKR
ncbi:MAG: thioredoxin-like domain-containing protein [Chitinophagales bacterium]